MSTTRRWKINNNAADQHDFRDPEYSFITQNPFDTRKGGLNPHHSDIFKDPDPQDCIHIIGGLAQLVLDKEIRRTVLIIESEECS